MRLDKDLLVVGSLSERNREPSYELTSEVSACGNFGAQSISKPGRSASWRRTFENRNQDGALAFANGCAVADGVSGDTLKACDDGAAASSIVCTHIIENVRHKYGSVFRMFNGARDAMRREKEHKVSSGSTFAMVRCINDRIAECDVEVAHAGDSRVYHFPQGGGRWHTLDHSAIGYLVDGGIEPIDLTSMLLATTFDLRESVVEFAVAVSTEFPKEKGIPFTAASRQEIEAVIASWSAEARWYLRRMLVQAVWEHEYSSWMKDRYTGDFDRLTPHYYHDHEKIYGYLDRVIAPDARDDSFTLQTINNVQPGDLFVCTSDGVTNVLDDDTIERFARCNDFDGLYRRMKNIMIDDTSVSWWRYPPKP